MVVNVIKWRPWSPLYSKRYYEATLTVRCLQGLLRPIAGDRTGDWNAHSPPLALDGFYGGGGLTVEISWKGPKRNGFKAFRRRSVKRNYTREQGLVVEDGVVQWDEEFKCDCRFSGYKDGSFHPWEVAFSIFNVSDQVIKSRTMVSSPAVLNLAEFVSSNGEQELEINIPLTISVGAVVFSSSLCLSLHLSELRANQESLEVMHRSSSMPLPASLSPCFGAPLTIENDEQSTAKRSLKKFKSLTDYVSPKRNGEASSDSKFSTGSEDSDNYPFDTDSFDYIDEESSEENKYLGNVDQKAVEYGTLVSANLAVGVFDLGNNCEDDGLVYYSNRKPEVEVPYKSDLASGVPDQSLKLSPKFGILWKKRKLNFRSPKGKGEPLLKKEYGERGGDDIDFDRMMLSADDISAAGCNETGEESLLWSEFGDDNFAVGTWEYKEIVSRDGSMKLQAQVFFASIDQRNEKAAGESACTALVVVIAHWLHTQRALMLTKSEFDGLIREGSLQWRNLCSDETLMTKFPDKHFDLDTVLQAGVCPIDEVAKNSFIGFFHVEGVEEEERLEFLHGAMSFDSIWDEIGRIASQSITKHGDSMVYIVSWNDHFFVLKIDSDAYYIIDTLGERLFEGCNQAFMLKFDKDSKIERVLSKGSKQKEGTTSSSSSSLSSPSSAPSSLSASLQSSLPLSSLEKVGTGGGVVGSAKLVLSSDVSHAAKDRKDEEDVEQVVVCRGKEACKEYIKSFLAAIPVRELRADIKRGLMGSAIPLHHRLQIEFHYTDRVLPPLTNNE